MIAVSPNVGGGVRFTVHVHAKHYKYEDGPTAPGMCGNGSVPLSHSGNVVTRTGIHTHTVEVYPPYIVPFPSLNSRSRIMFSSKQV